jgi:hypothetical protein
MAMLLIAARDITSFIEVNVADNANEHLMLKQFNTNS